ncbi:unnamed protein product [Candidula unifasciata]|uniref:RING-type domain-containing protein n=1 Tax=Candidula unifasciata TaxID=100452 RepID=A0A8S4A256_9EUPU|nr:unnamed protein product [Candidula unifasciata]
MESLCPNLEGSFGLRLLTKFDPVRHMPWRYVIQTFDQPSSEVPSNLYIFMNFEVFRLSSFDFRKFPKDDSIFVTNLAKSGFYFESETVKIVCFGCRHTFQGSRDCSQSSTNSSHSSLCPRHVFNKPIDQWIQDLPLDALTDYFIYNGSLTPYLEETPSSVGQSSSNLTPKNVLETKPILDSPQTSAMSYSSGYQSEDILFVEPERETHSDVQLLVTDSSCTNLLQFEYPSSINHSYSLPSNLNYISGVVVCEERPEPNGSHSVLTSAAKQPLLYKSKSSHNAEGTNEVAEEGAVGGILPLNLDAAAYPHFSIEAVRRKSFTDWSPQHTHRPEDLAVAGFFYAGYSDCVRCFYCGLGLKYWRPADIPAYQHAKYRPRCSFNILYKGQDYIDRVQQELRSEQEATNIVETQTAPQQSLGREQTTLTAQAAVDPQESDYLSSEAAQEALANGWTRDQVGQAVSHIVRVYGESCLGIELLTDILIHFNTSDELNQGLPCNSPASSHASEMNSSVSQVTTSYPSSAQLVDALASGENGQERPEGNHRTQEEATLVRTPHSEQPEVRVPDFRDILTSVEREHSLLEERVTCRVCKSRPVSCIYLPCGHVIACQECAESATHCVFCRKVIIGTANVFLA